MYSRYIYFVITHDTIIIILLLIDAIKDIVRLLCLWLWTKACIPHINCCADGESDMVLQTGWRHHVRPHNKGSRTRFEPTSTAGNHAPFTTFRLYDWCVKTVPHDYLLILQPSGHCPKTVMAHSSWDMSEALQMISYIVLSQRHLTMLQLCVL